MLTRLCALLLLLLILPPSRGSAQPGRVLTVWCMGSEGAAIAEYARRFEMERPGLHVRTQAIPWGGARDRLITAFVGDISPDVIQLGTTWVPEFAAIDALLPLDNYLSSPGSAGTDAFFAASLDGSRYNGTYVSIPWYVDVRVVFYRTDLLTGAGWTHYPESWQELEEMSRAVTADLDGDGQIDRHAISLPVRDDGLLMNFVWQNGGSALSADGSQVTFNSPRTIEALDLYRRIIREHYSPLDTATQLDPLQAFARGYVASWISGPWMVGEIRKRQPDLEGKWAVAMVPGRVTRQSFLGGSNLAIMKASRNPDLAWEFLQFMSRPDIQADWFRTTGDLPSVPAAWEAASLTTDPVWSVFRQQIENGRSTPPVENWEAMAEQIRGGLEEAILTDGRSEDIVLRTDAKLRALLAARRGNGAIGNAPSILRRALAPLLLLILVPLGIAAFIHRRAVWRARIAYALLAPIVIHCFCFLLLPMVASFVLSLTDYDLYSLRDWQRTSFLGIGNYRALGSDPVFWQSVVNTLYFVAVAGPLTIGLGLLVSLVLHQVKGRLRGALTVAFFLPVITPMVAVAVVWQWIYAPRDGLLNVLIAMVGMEPVPWLSDTRTALPALMLLAIWKNFGYSMVIFLGGLQAIPQELYEAAKLDGAGPLGILRNVTLPLLRPIMLFVAVLTIIGFMQFFSEPYIMTDRGGPRNRTLSITLYLYKEGFTSFRLGYASAIAYTLCAAIASLSIAQALAARWRPAK